MDSYIVVDPMGDVGGGRGAPAWAAEAREEEAKIRILTAENLLVV